MAPTAQAMTRRIILVTGPPCAGKTSYVQQHAEPGDQILDQDVIGKQAMRTALATLPHTAGTTWVIRCAPGPRARKALAEKLGAEHVHLDPGRDEIIARARQRPDPRRHIAAAGTWYATERANRAPRTTKPKGSATQRGYGQQHRRARLHALDDLKQHDGQPCTRCSQPMWHAQAALLDLDHTDDRAGYQGLAHRRCNRRAGQAKAMRIRASSQVTRSRNW
jgi:hypothetical protein